MKLHDRKSPRAQWHDYNGAEYFVTICTKDRTHYFGSVHNGLTQLTPVGECLKREIENTENLRHGAASIPLYVIMPNHVHLIVSLHNRMAPCRDALNASPLNASPLNASPLNASPLNASPIISDARGISDSDARGASLQKFGSQSGNLGAVIRGIKSAVTHFARENRIPFSWQPRYHDRIVRNRNEMNRIALYIEQNPMKWEMDCFYGGE